MNRLLRLRLASVLRNIANHVDGSKGAPPETSGLPSESEIIRERMAVWGYPVEFSKEQRQVLVQHGQRIVTKD